MKRTIPFLVPILVALAVVPSAGAFEVEQNSIGNQLLADLWNKDPAFPLDNVDVSVSQPSFVTLITPLIIPSPIAPLAGEAARFSFDVGPVDSGVTALMAITVTGDLDGVPMSSTKVIQIDVVGAVSSSQPVPALGSIGLLIIVLAIVAVVWFRLGPPVVASAAIVLLLVAAPVRADEPTQITTVVEAQPSPDLFTAFAGTDPDQADAAFLGLFELGEPAIDGLLGMTNNFDEYHGNGFYDPRSSFARIEFTPVALMAIYGVEAILRGRAIPHLAPVLREPNGTTEPISQAIQAYLDWWLINQGQPLPDLQAVPGPLDGLAFAWAGPLLPVAAAAGTGTEEGGSSTPFKKRRGTAICKAVRPGAKPYAWEFEKALGSAKIPYNCLAWAVGMHTDRWIQPSRAGAAGQKLDDILDDHGYDEANPVTCAAKCPKDKGPKVKLIFNKKKAADAASEANWQHAMKQEADGDWSSKNGRGSRYKDITDCTKFIDKHYPLGAGETRELKCYCK